MPLGHRLGSKRRAATALVMAALGLAALPAATFAQTKNGQADKRAAAREAYTRGERAFELKDYAAAAEHFRTANELVPTPHAEYWIAQSLDHQGQVNEAIVAYKELLANPQAEKIGQLKLDTARARLAVLEVPEEQPAVTQPQIDPQPEPAPPPPSEPPPTLRELDPHAPRDFGESRPKDRYKPQDGLWELGIFGGPLIVSRAHNLHEERFFRRAYERPAWLFGARAAFFPSKYAGVEVEYAHGRGEVVKRDDAVFNSARGHLIGQLPFWRVVPFALAGAGFLEGRSDAQGNDADFLVELGVGAKVAATPLISPRLDLRLDMMQRQGGGVSFSEEIHLGLSFVLGR